MSNQNLMKNGTVMSKDALISELEWIITRLQTNDSFEGSISYSAFNSPPEVELRRDQFFVQMFIRHDNLQGQGSVRSTITPIQTKSKKR